MADLLFVQGDGNQVLLDDISMDAVVYPGEVSANVPARLFLIFVFEALELFDEKELELHRNPHAKFKGNLLVRVCAAIPAFAFEGSGRTWPEGVAIWR